MTIGNGWFPVRSQALAVKREVELSSALTESGCHFTQRLLNGVETHFIPLCVMLCSSTIVNQYREGVEPTKSCLQVSCLPMALISSKHRTTKWLISLERASIKRQRVDRRHGCEVRWADLCKWWCQCYQPPFSHRRDRANIVNDRTDANWTGRMDLLNSHLHHHWNDHTFVCSTTGCSVLLG
jgi:hypothetical protein